MKNRESGLSARQAAERRRTWQLFNDWHLDTYFVPFNPDLSAHIDRMEGFLAGARRKRRVRVLKMEVRDE